MKVSFVGVYSSNEPMETESIEETENMSVCRLTCSLMTASNSGMLLVHIA